MKPLQEFFVLVDIEADEYANQTHGCNFDD